MNRAILIGVIMAAGALVALFVVPPIFPSGTSGSQASLRKAAQAARESRNFDPRLDRIARLADLPDLKKADLAALAERQPEAFQQLNEDLRKRIQEEQQADVGHKLPRGDYKAPPTSGSGLKSAVDGFAALAESNRALLADALKHATEANESGKDTIGVPEVLGVVQLVRADTLRVEAEALRAKLSEVDAHLIALVSDWRIDKAGSDHYAGLEPSKILEGLRKDLAETTAKHEQAQTLADELTQKVSQRKTELEKVRTDLAAAQAELLKLEGAGFKLGDDAAFEQYKHKYEQLTIRRRELQEREQSLADGALVGARLDEGDLLKGKIEGGAPQPGLTELERELIFAKATAERLAKSRKALEDRIKSVTTGGQESDKLKTRFAQAQAAAKSQIEPLLQEINKLSQDAFAKEKAAADAAAKAAQAFNTADQAAKQWIDAAQQAQRDSDADRKNPRLKQIIDDRLSMDMPRSAAAAAKLVLARINAQSATEIENHIRVLERFGDLMPEAKVDKQEMQASADGAREAAVKSANEAVTAFDALTKAKPETAWIPRCSMAAAYYLLSTIDARNAPTHRQKAIEAIEAAVGKAEKSPYTQTAVRFKELLAAGGGK